MAIWLKKGDKNTKFFQKTANAHLRFNYIDQLLIDGKTVKEPADIKRHILSLYHKFYTETELWRPSLNISNRPRLSEDEKLRSQRPFEEKEVLQIINQSAIDKAPGTYSYMMGFFSICWEIIKGDIMNIVHNFTLGNFLKKGFNATYVALIPKKNGAKELKDFRPIRLIGQSTTSFLSC